MKVHIKKLFGGKVSVRSYLVKYCKKTRTNLVIEFEGQKMTVEYPNLDRYTTDGNTYTAKRYDQYIRMGDKYKLYDYIWRPDVEPASWTKQGMELVISAWKKIKNKHI